MDKKELRKQVKVLKSQYSLEQKVEMSRPLWKELEQTDFFKEARTVLLYWSMDDEVFTHDYVCQVGGEEDCPVALREGRRVGITGVQGHGIPATGGGFRHTGACWRIVHGLRCD